MRRSVESACLGFAVLGIVIASASTACRDATSITVEISTDFACDGTSKVDVGIAAGELGSIETRPFLASKTWCETKPGRVGSLVLVPRGADDEEVAIRVVAGVGRPAGTCTGDFAGCIVERRIVRYSPHTNVDVPVVLTAACVAIPCGEGRTCKEGVCVAVEPPPSNDAGTTVTNDATVVADTSVADTAPADTGPTCQPLPGTAACCDKNISCIGTSATCSDAQCGKCVLKCSADPTKVKCCVDPSKIEPDGLPHVDCKHANEACP